jgi:putative N6-adenine-specific DNA methylase
VIEKNKFNIVVKTVTGLEEVLAREISQTGAENIQVLNRAVTCTGSREVIYRINYFSRTALRVLVVIKTCRVRNEEELYQQVHHINWQPFIAPGQTIAVDAVTGNAALTHSHYAALKTKDAIVDQFRGKFGKRPSVNVENPDIRINLHLVGDECTISLDSSNESLHKRGYRMAQGEAPLSEVLAAGMILLTGWNGETTFYDPMCGSGTLICEAAMIAKIIPAGYFRRSFGFEKWNDFDKNLFEKIKTEGQKNIRPLACKIFGSDINLMALKSAKKNLASLGAEDEIKTWRKDFEESNPPDTSGFIITNPPYGERLQKDDLNAFYKKIGDTLKKNFSGWEAWLITSDAPALKSVGLRTSKKIILNNGPLECRFVKYEMYEGSKK